jgi:EmrB/QacA subfamily drug resistance transporter
MTNGVVKVNKHVTIWAASLSSFLGAFMGSSVNVALPSIGSEFGMAAISLSWVATAYLMAAAIFLVPFGKLADMYGRKKIFLGGMILYTISSGLIGFASSGTMLILTRALQGIGTAMIFATGMAIIISVFPLGERGKALGIAVGAVYLGLSLGPLVGGLITQTFGWRYIFWLNVPFGALISGLIAFGLHGDWVESAGARFDYLGAITLGAALVFPIAGLSMLPSAAGIISLVVGLLGFAAFIICERKISEPLVDLDMFLQNRVFSFSSLAALINYSTTAGVSFLLSLYLQYIKGLSPKMAGFVMVSQPIVQTIFAPIAGSLSDKIQPRTVASMGMGLTLVGLLLLVFLGPASSILFIVICFAFLGFGIALFSSPNTNAIMSSVDKQYLGVASAIVGTMRLIGQMLSMGVVMLVFALIFGSVKITPEYYPYLIKSARIIFIIFAVFSLGGIFASLARGHMQRDNIQISK